MNLAQLRSLNRGLAYFIMAIVPLAFWRSVTDSFDLTKGTVLNIFGTFLLGALVLLAIVGGFKQVAKPVWIATGVLALASIVTTATSMAPIVSIVGQSQRYTGLATILSGLLLVVALVAAFSQRQVVTAVQVLAGTAVIVALYTLVQESNNDPFEWFSESFGKFVFSTLGNPNTGAAYTAVTLPVVAWAMLRRDHHVGVRVTAGATFGAALGALAAFDSFQGPVTAVVTIVYLVAWALLHGRTTGTWLVVVIMAAAIFVLPTRSSSAWLMLLAATVFGGLAYLVPRMQSITLPEGVYRQRKAIAAVAGVVVLGGLVVAGPSAYDRVQAEVEGGMVERGDFYRAAIEVFKDQPIVGSGLETFGFEFTANRPEGHAVRLERSRTSSVHSVPLGMFSNGGVVLGVAYLGFVGFVGFSLVRALRRDVRAGSGALLAAGTAWLAYQVQSLVSVEHVALFTVHFALAGIVLAFAYPSAAETAVVSGPKGRARTARARSRGRQVPGVAVAGVGVLAVLMVAFVITRPMQAARASFLGLGALYQQQDLGTGVRELNNAIDRAPWEALYRIQLAEIQQQTGDLAGAAESAKKAAQTSFYNPGVTPQLAQLVAASGDVNTAIDMAERAMANDPFAVGVRNSVADLYAAIGATKAQAGDTDEARTLLERALELNPENQAAKDALAGLDAPQG